MTFALLQLQKFFVPIECEDCFLIELYADCVNKLVSFPPNNLRKDIEVLDISSNQLEILTEKQFIGFTNLKQLKMAYTNILSVSQHVFDPLTKLELLNISATFLGKPWPRLPSSIKRLIAEEFAVSRYLHHGDVSEIDFSELYNLEELHLKQNNLEKFPSIPLEAPLTLIDLSDNVMSELKYADIAPFCKLKQLLLGGDRSSLNLNPDLLQQCCGVKMWLKKHNITSDLSCAGNCTDQEFDSKSNEAYEICIESYESENEMSLYGKIVNIFLSLALIIAMGYLAWKYYGSHAVRFEHNINKMDKEQMESTEEEEQVEETFEE